MNAGACDWWQFLGTAHNDWCCCFSSWGMFLFEEAYWGQQRGLDAWLVQLMLKTVTRTGGKRMMLTR
jgi:hypothetical protein